MELIKEKKINEINRIDSKEKRVKNIFKILISNLIIVMHNLLFHCVYAAFDINVFVDNYLIKVLMFIIFIFLIIFAVKIYKMSKEEKKYTLEEMKELKRQKKVSGFEEIEKGKRINKNEKIDESTNYLNEEILKNHKFVESSILDQNNENLKNNLKTKRKKKKKIQKRRDIATKDNIIIKSKEEQETKKKESEKEDKSNNVSTILNDIRNNNKFEIQLNDDKTIESKKEESKSEKDKNENNIELYNLISNKQKEKDKLNEKISNMMFGIQNDSIHNELDDIIYNYKKRNLKTKIDLKQKQKTQEARINLNGMINKIVELGEQKNGIEEKKIDTKVSFEDIGKEFQNELGEKTKIIFEENNNK